MTDVNHQEVMAVLQTMLKVQALAAVRDLPSKKQKILFLADAGLAPKEIALIVGSSAASVSQTVYEAKKQRASRGGEDA
jgi:DNA-directed RNA polymerase specialized sigma24 family protein